MTQNPLPPELLEGMRRLIQQLVPRLAAGEQFDNPKFTVLADAAFGGTRAEGVYTCRDAYDALEVAVNRLLLESKARAFMHAKAEVLQSLRLRIVSNDDLLKDLERQGVLETFLDDVDQLYADFRKRFDHLRIQKRPN